MDPILEKFKFGSLNVEIQYYDKKEKIITLNAHLRYRTIIEATSYIISRTYSIRNRKIIKFNFTWKPEE